MRFCLLVCLAMSSVTAVEATPFTSLDPVVSVSTLVGMRSGLAGASLADPRLATAEMALVDLALNGEPRDRGGRGCIWRHRARELRDLRRSAHEQAASFEDAIPDLWVDALDGRTAQCLAALDTWPESKDTPHGRALRCLCTRDWRPIRQLPQSTAHERLALAIAYWQCGMGQSLERLPHDDLPPFAYDTLIVATVGFSHEATAGVLRSAEQECWMLAASPSLPAGAVPAADAYLAHLGIPAHGDRRHAAARIAGKLANAPTEDGETLLAAWQLADRATSGDAGLRAGDTWLLGGIGDWATAARLDLFLGSWHRHDFVRFSWGVPDDADRLSGPVAKADEGLFSAWHRWLASRWRDAAAARAVLAGVDLELGRPAGGIPPMRLIGCANEVWQRVGDLRQEAAACIRRIVAAQRATEPGASAGWGEIGRVCEQVHDLASVNDDLVAAAKADPWSSELARLSAICRDGSIPAWTAAPEREWTAQEIDRREGGFPEAGRADRVGIRWTGTLTVPTAGRWRFATDSDDGSTLHIGEHLVVENGGDHAMVQVADEIDLAAGPASIDLRWFNTGGGAGCRLLWQAPGAASLTPVPAEALHTPEGHPGLHAASWFLDRTPAETPVDVAALQKRFADMPWRLDVGVQLFNVLYDLERWSEALTIVDAVLEADPGNASVGPRRGTCLQRMGRVDEAVAAWKQYLATSTAFNTIFTRLDIARALEHKGDLAGAEKYFGEAANSWQAAAMLECARFLGRRGRKDEALQWVDRCKERYHAHLGVLAAMILLTGDATASDIDAAFERLAPDVGELTTSEDVYNLCCSVRRLALHDRFLALVPNPPARSESSLPILVGIMRIEAGRAADGAQLLASIIADGRLDDSWMPWVLTWQTLGARLAHRGDLAPSADRLRQFRGVKVDPTLMGCPEAALAFLAGDVDRPGALAMPNTDTDEMRYYLAVDEAARHDVPAAKEDLTATSTHPTWSEFGGAKRFRAWLDDGAKAPTEEPAKPDF